MASFSIVGAYFLEEAVFDPDEQPSDEELRHLEEQAELDRYERAADDN